MTAAALQLSPILSAASSSSPLSSPPVAAGVSGAGSAPLPGKSTVAKPTNFAAIQAQEEAHFAAAQAAGLRWTHNAAGSGSSKGLGPPADQWGPRLVGTGVKLSEVLEQERLAADRALALQLQAECDAREAAEAAAAIAAVNASHGLGHGRERGGGSGRGGHARASKGRGPRHDHEPATDASITPASSLHSDPTHPNATSGVSDIHRPKASARSKAGAVPSSTSTTSAAVHAQGAGRGRGRGADGRTR